MLLHCKKKWNGRNKVWKYLIVIAILLVAAFPTYLYLSEEYAEKKEIAVKESQIEKIRKDVGTFFEYYKNELDLHADADGYIPYLKYYDLMTEFTEEYTKYLNDSIYSLTDDELKHRAILETTLLYNEYFNIIDDYKVKVD